ncbi:hypothetical protein BGZ73_001596 [Actinomortierella ambigua]|nr:hypothetical protein BGZ73_001596 [Actinomortierella ambigua]
MAKHLHYWARSQAKAAAFCKGQSKVRIKILVATLFPSLLSGLIYVAESKLSVLSPGAPAGKGKPRADNHYQASSSDNNTNSNNIGSSGWLSSLGPATVLRPYPVRAIFYGIASIPCFLFAPNYSGGLCLVCCSLTFGLAGWVERSNIIRQQHRQRPTLRTPSAD